MKKSNLLKKSALSALIAVSIISCDKGGAENPTGTTGPYYNIALSPSPEEGVTATYVQALTKSEIESGDISFSNNGFNVPSVRSARIYSTDYGTQIFNLSYGGGTVTSYTLDEKSSTRHNFIKEEQTNLTQFFGTEYVRWTRIDNSKALVHNVRVENVYNSDETEYQYTEAEGAIVDINFSDMGMANSNIFTMPRVESETDNKYLYINRIDAPVVVDGKAYYGVSISKRSETDPTTNEKGFADYKATTLVVDYPTLDNPKLITSNLSKGSTYGYRIPVSYTIDNNIYQISGDGRMLQIANGDYNNSYDFNISTALGLGFNIGTQGWFYVGDGIGYCLYYNIEDAEGKSGNTWGVARIDINSKTATKMNTPSDLNLFEYQMAKVVDNKLYMALTPKGADGNVYIFDATSNSSDGFTKGAALKSLGGTSLYVGIF